jgi:prepilin-type N-terminal cleavage/methylation domain-containing protein/prepilin-type processing-associated H-X9-DG protein
MGENRGFSLTELLIVISTVSLVMAVSTPALIRARSQAKAVVCRSNLRQLVLANLEYSNDNKGFFVPAAEDLWESNGGKKRWHGQRNSGDEVFDPLKGPFSEYMGGGKIKECPDNPSFKRGGSWSDNFEQGCGGYGYNLTYIGSRLWAANLDFKSKYAETVQLAEVRRPRETLMFADCAMSVSYGTYIEYSFAEPVHPIINGKVKERIFLSPSIHFRHKSEANVGWVDGHVDSRPMAATDGSNVWNVNSANMNLGWFEPMDNTPFDLY